MENVAGLPHTVTLCTSNPEVSRRRVGTGTGGEGGVVVEQSLTSYDALAKSWRLSKSTTASHDKCVTRASSGFEREDGSRDMVVQDYNV